MKENAMVADSPDLATQRNAAAGPLDSGRLRRRIYSDDLLLGTFAGIASPIAVEVCAAAGADWVLVDLEHGGGSEEVLSPSILAAGAYGVPAVVRVESADEVRVGRALDAGAAGVMFPRAAGVADVKRAVSFLRYPPVGVRGAATYNRQGRFGLDPDALGDAGDRVVGIIQIETLGALTDIGKICAVDGVDVVFVGPLDLSYALGTPRDFRSPAFERALDSVIEAARENSVAPGILASTEAAAREYAARGFSFVGVGSDGSMLAQAMSGAFRSVRDHVA
jgi:4-hydroxy-2-oxoheptanedioate aldolase